MFVARSPGDVDVCLFGNYLFKWPLHFSTEYTLPNSYFSASFIFKLPRSPPAFTFGMNIFFSAWTFTSLRKLDLSKKNYFISSPPNLTLYLRTLPSLLLQGWCVPVLSVLPTQLLHIWLSHLLSKQNISFFFSFWVNSSCIWIYCYLLSFFPSHSIFLFLKKFLKSFIYLFEREWERARVWVGGG